MDCFRDWDPRETDFKNAEFNSYNRGPGARLDQDLQPWSKSVEKRKGPYKLYISNIPLNITENGLKNIFCKYGDISSVKKSVPEPGHKFCYGFVTYGTHSEAERAIREINNQKPLFLRVQFARSDTERERLRQKKEEERLVVEAVSNCEFNEQEFAVKRSPGVGRGKLLESLQVKKDRDIKYGSSLLTPSFHNEDYYSSYEDHRFDEANQILMKTIHSSRNSSMGHRRVSFGRGHLYERSPQSSARHSMTDILHKDFCDIEHTTEMDISLNEIHRYGTPVHVLSRRAGPCLNCSRTTSSVCRRCRDFYCSQACQEHDWHNHRPLCFPIPGIMNTSENDYNRNSGSPFGIVPEHLTCSIDNEEMPNDLQTVKSKYPADNHIKRNREIFEYKRDVKSKCAINNDYRENSTTKICMKNEKLEVINPHNSSPTKNKGTRRQVESEGNVLNNRGKQPNGNTKFDKRNLSSKQCKDTKVTYNNVETSDNLKNTISSKSNTKIEEIKLSEDLSVSEKQEKPISRGDLSLRNSADVDTMPIGLAPIENTINSAGDCQIKHEKLDNNDFTEVNVAYNEGSKVYWIQKKSALPDLYKVLNLLQDCDKMAFYTPQAGGICGALFEGVWYRAEIITVTPKLMVRYIDFGNEEMSADDKLRVLPLNALSLPAQAIKVRLADGTPDTYDKLKEDTSLAVMPLCMSEDGCAVVKVKGVNYESNEVKPSEIPVKTTELKSADSTLNNQMNITHGREESAKNKNICPIGDALSGLSVGMIGFMQIKAILNPEAFTVSIVHEGIEDEFSAICDLNDYCEKHCEKSLVKAQVGDLVAAEVDSVWYRAYVLQEYETLLGVSLCDVGYCAKVSKVMTLPDDYVSIPELCVRCDISEFVESKANLWNNYLKINEKLKFHVEEISSDIRVAILHDTKGKLCEVCMKRWQPLAEEPGIRCIRLKNHMPVILNVVMSHKILYVRPADIKSVEKFNRLVQDVGLHCLSAPDINYVPVKGELVACRYAQDGNYYRGVIESFDNDLILISFIDFGNREKVSLKDLKALSEDLKKVPAFAVKVALKKVVEKPMTSKALAYIQDFILNEQILKLEFVTLKEVELFESDGTSINAKINSFINGNTSDKQDEIIYNLNDAQCVELPVGKSIDFYIGHYMEPESILGTYPGCDTFTYVTLELQKEINDYCNQTEETFLPRVDELCLAKYEDEWYRAACLNVKANQAKLLFVDFGNIELVSFKDIRKMVADFSSSPVLAVRCVLERPPKSEDDIKKLKAILLVGTLHKIKVLNFDEGVYSIELL